MEKGLCENQARIFVQALRPEWRLVVDRSHPETKYAIGRDGAVSKFPWQSDVTLAWLEAAKIVADQAIGELLY